MTFAPVLSPVPSDVATRLPFLSRTLAVRIPDTSAETAVAVYRGLLGGLLVLAGLARTIAILQSRLSVVSATFTLAIALTLSRQFASPGTLQRATGRGS